MPESILLSDGVKLFHIPSGKYKTNYLSIYFTLPLTEKTPTYMSLLSKVMKRGSESYPTMASLNSALDVNYASTASLVSSKEGEKAVFLLHLSTMKNAYAMNGEDVFGEAVRIALDILFRPLFESVAFESEKKKKLPESFLINHISSTFVETIRWWVENGKKETAETVTEYFFSVL